MTKDAAGKEIVKVFGNSTVYWADWISTLCARTTTLNKKTGHFGVLHNKSSYTNIYTHVGSAPPSCFGTKNDHLTTPSPLSFFSLDTCSIDTDHYANFRILRKKEKKILLPVLFTNLGVP